MTKKIVSILICVLMLIPLCVAAGAADDKQFKDVPEKSWYTKAVYWCVEKGYFSGTSKDTFSPKTEFTRAQFVTVLSQIEGIDKSEYKNKVIFKDVPAGKWFSAAVNWAKESGVVSGKTADTFAPNDPVTREQVCVMLVAYLKYKNLIIDETVTGKEFNDSGKISKWAKKAVAKAVGCGLISGDTAGNLDPKGKCLRNMAVVMIKNFAEKLESARKPQLIAYYNALVRPPEAELRYVDVINFHPARVDSSDPSSSGFVNDEYSYQVPDLRERAAEDYGNDDLKIIFTLASNNIGVFETAMVNPALASAIVSRVEEYDFDGVDIDYEFPQVSGLYGKAKELKQGYFTKCMQRIRDGLDALSQKTGKTYTLSMAVPGGSWTFDLYDMDSLKNIVDYFNIMNYDTYVNRGMTLHHTSPYDNATIAGASTASDIALYKEKGIPASMVVPGCGTYSRRWTNVEPGPNGDGLYQPGTIDDSNIHYSTLVSQYIGPRGKGVNGYTRYWDDNAKAPYLYNPTTKTFLSYDDLESITYKIDLIREGEVRGLMMFDYALCTGQVGDKTKGTTFIQEIYDRLTK
ncbi:MAG: S-layer homology domain-containing protein [Clostridia bacterium]|nr:S-layer homology domain-containing protein [Clostridia bacterium]